jgi:hypothetical protein
LNLGRTLAELLDKRDTQAKKTARNRRMTAEPYGWTIWG